MKAPSQVILLQNVGSQPKLFSADLIDQQTSLYQTIPTTTSNTSVSLNNATEQNGNAPSADVIEIGIPREAIELDKNTQVLLRKISFADSSFNIFIIIRFLFLDLVERRYKFIAFLIDIPSFAYRSSGRIGEIRANHFIAIGYFSRGI